MSQTSDYPSRMFSGNSLSSQNIETMRQTISSWQSQAQKQGNNELANQLANVLTNLQQAYQTFTETKNPA